MNSLSDLHIWLHYSSRGQKLSFNEEHVVEQKHSLTEERGQKQNPILASVFQYAFQISSIFDNTFEFSNSQANYCASIIFKSNMIVITIKVLLFSQKFWHFLPAATEGNFKVVYISWKKVIFFL